MLKVSNVYAGYHGTEVLRDVSFEVNAGEVITIVGANGAGKTTVLRSVCGLIKPQAGAIEFENRRTDGMRPDEIVDLGITLVPEGRQLFPFISVRDNLLMGAYKRKARKGAGERLDEVLELFPAVRERLNQHAGSLSGGEQQMVAIARGLMAKPELLIFDEPSLGLSPLLVSQVFGIIGEIVKSGSTVLIVEQNIVHTLRMADRGYVLENGAVVATGAGPDLLNDPHVKRAYLGI
ncbi:ABC transporter ATP-binding protein [Aliamphritea hakodatensis]|uniref:ABC transporter ATP-binding protein n=1 Tax=Aliamphritea hakodatensis TaxID=2895352 RepID=UPI0022FDA86C|nr:ABC transporter ATP-binding protein [Aliamphritea hakodatensis]